MLWLVAGALLLLALLAGARAFERASVGSIKALLAWIAALGGLALALLLVLSERDGAALGALVMFGPLIWRHVGPSILQHGRMTGSRAASRGPPWAGPMTRAEAYEVLGLQSGASEAEIRAAHLRLMRHAHPDAGGSEWLAVRVNQARDVLLG